MKVFHPLPFPLQTLVELPSSHLLLEDDDGIHQLVERVVQLLSGVAQQILR